MARIISFEGRRISVPDDATPEEINSIIGKPVPPQATETQGPANDGLGRTVFDQGMQGATFGFADEASDALGALFAAPFVDESVGELYDQARGMSKRDLSAQQEEHPIASTLAQIGGGLATSVAGSVPATIGKAATKQGAFRQLLNRIPEAGQDLAKTVASGSMKAKMAKGAATGATAGAVYGAGTADDGERMEGAAKGAGWGALTGGLAPPVMKAAGKVITAPADAVINRQLQKAGVDTAKMKPNLSLVDPDEALAKAVQPVREQFEQRGQVESQLWDDARENAVDTLVKNDVTAGLKGRIDQVLRDEEGISLADDALKPLADRLKVLDKFDPPAVGTGELPNQATGTGAPLNDIIAARRAISQMAAKNPDGNIRSAAGVALREFDNHLEDNLNDAILKGDDQGIQKFKKAIDFSRKQFQDFGTNKKAGQDALFEKIITKSEVDNAQLADAFGATSRGKAGTSQAITRLLKQAGPRREEVRSNLAKGMVARAIRKSTKEIEDGEEIIMPDRLRSELTRLINESRSSGGAGKQVRDQVFTEDELKGLIRLRNNMKDPRNFWGAMRQMGVKIPLAGQAISKPQIAAGRKARKQVEDFLSIGAKEALPLLKGKPMTYTEILGAQQAADRTEEPKNKKDKK